MYTRFVNISIIYSIPGFLIIFLANYYQSSSVPYEILSSFSKNDCNNLLNEGRSLGIPF